MEFFLTSILKSRKS